jgi:hypothetical protein
VHLLVEWLQLPVLFIKTNVFVWKGFL